MDLIFDLVELPVLTQAARKIDPPEAYGVLQALLPERTIPDVEYKIRRGTITRGVAQYRAWDAPTPMGRRQATSTDTKQALLPFGQMLMVGEYESIMLQRAQGASGAAIIEQIYDDTASNVRAIRARMQRAIGQVLSTGTFVLDNENGLSDVATFDVPASHLNVVPSKLFSDDTSDILGFLEQLADLYEADSDDGQRPGRFTAGRAVGNALRRNLQLTRLSKGALNSSTLPLTLTEVNDAITSFGLPPIAIDQSKVAGQYVIPQDMLIATPADPTDLGRTVYGITGQSLLLVNTNAVDFAVEDAPGIVATTWKTPNPAAVYSSADASGMPVLERPELLITARVL